MGHKFFKSIIELHQNKNLCSVKDSIKMAKRQIAEEIFANHIADKASVSHKQPSKLNRHKNILLK
jgi:hypothetical protein